MSLSHFLRKFGQPNPTRPAPVDAGKARPWGWKTLSTDGRPSLSRAPTPPQESTAETSTPDGGVSEELLAGLGNPPMEPGQEMILAPKPVPDKLSESWSLVKSGPPDSDLNRRFGAFGTLMHTSFLPSTLILAIR